MLRSEKPLPSTIKSDSWHSCLERRKQLILLNSELFHVNETVTIESEQKRLTQVMLSRISVKKMLVCLTRQNSPKETTQHSLPTIFARHSSFRVTVASTEQLVACVKHRQNHYFFYSEKCEKCKTANNTLYIIFIIIFLKLMLFVYDGQKFSFVIQHNEALTYIVHSERNMSQFTSQHIVT